MPLTYVRLQDLRFLKTQLFNRIIARCILGKNCFLQRPMIYVKLQDLCF